MKIMITFTQEEKETIMAIAKTVGPIQPDQDEHIAGSFGEFKYDSIKNEMVYDLKPGFIIATAHLMASCINMIKAFMGSCEMYASCWLKDVKDLTKKENEKPQTDVCE